MPPKKNIGPRVSGKTREWITENFSSISAGAELILECNRVLYARTLQEISGKFTEDELKAMLDVMNAHFLTPFVSGTELQLSVDDACQVDGLDQKWKIDRKEILQKLENLTIYQRAVLEWWANGFWYGGGDDRPERDVEKYIATIAAHAA